MSIDLKAPAEVERLNPGKAGTLARVALIGVILAAIVATFAYLGGWLTSNQLTPARFVDGFEEVNGVHSGFRRNHAKGVSVSGSFESNGNGLRLSKASLFQPGTLPVLGRFSLGGGQPDMADGSEAVRLDEVEPPPSHEREISVPTSEGYPVDFVNHEWSRVGYGRTRGALGQAHEPALLAR